ncbi:MAG: (2Fe-2S)-binding protein [Acidobacteriaceae bacterium]|nr:(2Fe-2S)-binding protein [Acidobacteriaceae bacterium]
MPDERKPHFSRRGFLRGAGQTAAGGLVLENVQALTRETKEALHTPKALGPDDVPITLIVNGAKHQIHCEPRTTLAEALRNHIGLTGTKVVCDRGSCSACTVWLDKMPALACMTLAVDVGTRQITTIEGLAKGENLHPVQAAFIKHDALQCGFCTSGMIMSCAALLERNPHPQLEDVKQAVSGNLCRCGTYPKVFAATLDAAAKEKA